MELKFRKSMSTIRPEEVDEISSPTVTYIRKDITEVTPEPKDDDMPATTYFEYQEAVLTKAEYQMYLQEQATDKVRADIDFIALMGGYEI